MFYKDQGDNFAKSGDLTAAYEAYSECIRLKPDFYKGWMNRSLILFRGLRYQESLDDLDEVSKILSKFELQKFSKSKLIIIHTTNIRYLFSNDRI